MRLLLGTPSTALPAALLPALALSLLPAATSAAPPSPSTSSTPPAAPAPDWETTVVDADQSFRGLDAVGRRTAWVAGGSLTDGGAGRVYRTTDGGTTWDDVTPPGTEGLSLRDVEATGTRTAVVLSIGPGEDSRIFRTTDGGRTWSEAFRNTDPDAFYNCLDLYPGQRRGLAVSDPVDGKFRIAATRDGGASWRVLPAAGMPDSTGEYNYSASGDCLSITGRTAWFGSGGTDARVFRSTDRGRTWTAADTGLPTGEAAGVFAVVFRTPREGVAVGGDFVAPADGTDAAATSRTGGRAWTGGADLAHLGEDAAWRSRRLLLTTGESGDVAGSSLSRDGGRTWRQFSTTGFHTLDCTRGGSCWAAGGGGRVGVLD